MRSRNFSPHCILNEFRTVFQTACEQSEFRGGFVSRRAIIWAFWLGSSSRGLSWGEMPPCHRQAQLLPPPAVPQGPAASPPIFLMLISFRTEVSPSVLTHIYWTWLLLAVKGLCAQNAEWLSGHSSRGERLRCSQRCVPVELVPLKWVKHEPSWASFEGRMLLWIAVGVLLRMPSGLKALL